MEYPVIAACSVALQEAGFVTVRFNFRGVQGSEGNRSGGLYEPRDVQGVSRSGVFRAVLGSSGAL